MTEELNKKNIKIIGICGSIRKGGNTMKALKIAMEGAADAGAEIQIIDLNEYDLPFCNGTEVGYPDDVFKLRAEVKDADGLILATPEYHGNFSGVLKNAIDLMGFNEFEGKMLGLIGVAGGAMGAHNSLNSLRTIGRQLHAWVIPEQTSIASVGKAFDENDRLIDKALEKRVMNIGEKVARFAYLHAIEKSGEFVKAWESALENPGGRRY